MSASEEPPLAPRPSLPTLTWLVAALWVGLVAAERAEWVAYTGGRMLSGVVLVAAVGMAVCALEALRRGRSLVALCLIGLCAGAVLGCLFWGHWRLDAAALAAARTSKRDVEVLADETISQFGASSTCRLTGGVADGSLVTVQWPMGVQAPALGRRVEVVGEVKAPTVDARGERAARAGNAGILRARLAYDRGWATSVRGLIGRVRLWAVGRMANVSGEGGALLSGVVIGDRRRLAGTQADIDFRTTGLTHLVAVSGSHLVVVAAVVGWLVASAGASRLSRSLVVAVAVGGYVVFSGVQPSAVRAWVMAVASSSAWMSGRRADGGSTLSVAAAGVLATSPSAAFDLGFELSVAAVAGLVLFARFAETWLVAALGRRGRWIASPVALTLTATAATMPITVSTFGMLSLVSPAANVVAGPLVSVALVVGLVGLVIGGVWDSAGVAMLALAAVPASAAVRAAHFLASWPYAAVPISVAAAPAGVACAAVGTVVWASWLTPTRWRARGAVGVFLVGMGLVALGPPVSPGGTIEVLDVGQGDAILVRDGSHAVLVDAGPSVGPMRAALARAGVRRLDAVVITHLHADHYGGLGAMTGVVSVPTVLVPSGACASDSQAISDVRALVGAEGVREVSASSSLVVGRLTLDVLWPREQVQDAATNEASIVLRVREGRFSALLTGDAEGEVLQPLVSDGTLGDVDVLKVGHHGSAGAVTSDELRVLRPEYSLISVGTGNKFGHPTASTLAELARAGSRVLRTDRCGDITVRVSPDGAYKVLLSRVDEAAVSSERSERRLRGRLATGCATLDSTAKSSAARAVSTTESHGQAAFRVQAGLPHLRRARPPPGARTRTAQAQRRRAC